MIICVLILDKNVLIIIVLNLKHKLKKLSLKIPQINVKLFHVRKDINANKGNAIK